MSQIIDLRELTDANLDNAIAFENKEITNHTEVLNILLKEKNLRLKDKNKDLLG